MVFPEYRSSGERDQHVTGKANDTSSSIDEGGELVSGGRHEQRNLGMHSAVQTEHCAKMIVDKRGYCQMWREFIALVVQKLAMFVQRLREHSVQNGRVMTRIWSR